MYTNKYMSLHRFKKIALLTGCLISSSGLFAQAPVPDAMEDPFVVVMVVIMVILALIIGLLAWVVLGSAQLYLQKWKQQEEEEKKKSNPVTTTVTSVVALLLLSTVAKADEGAAAVTARVHNLSDTTFYTMTGVIFLELIVIGALLYNLRVLLEIRRKKAVAANGAPAKPTVTWWDKVNKFKPVEQEESIDLGHEYDGIRELDNRLPPWWLYGFYCTIFFAVIYLWRFHVSHTAPLSGEEYQLAVKEADIKRAEYLKNAANNVDESTVKLLTESTDLAAGQKVFESLCAACHGKKGEGGVGPNLTDEYWLHGGGIKDVFKTIKYGVPEKGMKSWKDDYSPGQIAQIASYIKSLKGTNPPNGKAPQGTVYKEETAATDQQ
jgi:cytochrome c oxidase cbb3-type subunit 3